MSDFLAGTTGAKGDLEERKWCELDWCPRRQTEAENGEVAAIGIRGIKRFSEGSQSSQLMISL